MLMVIWVPIVIRHAQEHRNEITNLDRMLTLQIFILVNIRLLYIYLAQQASQIVYLF